jgi:signal transduction histidine kinase
MAADIAQLDAIIGKFLDYARPEKDKLQPVVLADVVEACAYSYKNQPDMSKSSVQLEDNLLVLADEVELGRIISNLLENARRYGKSVDTGIARIHIAAISARQVGFDQNPRPRHWCRPGPTANLTQPFYRGEAARTAANGAGSGPGHCRKNRATHGRRVFADQRPRRRPVGQYAAAARHRLITNGHHANYRLAASTAPSRMARLASSSLASAAPPIL